VDALRRRDGPPRLRDDVLELDEGAFEVDLAVHDPERRLRDLDRDGIDVAVVSLQPTLGLARCPEVVDAFHAAMPAIGAASGGRLRAWAAGDAVEGFAGACVTASSVLAGVDELAGELERRGQALFVHPGPASRPDGRPAWWTAVVDYVAEMQAAWFAWLTGGAARFPRLPVVFGVLAGGAPVQLERLAVRGGPMTPIPATMYLDTASYGRLGLGLAVEALGRERLVFGSDAPVCPAETTLAALAALGDDILAAVTIANPGRFLS
jgi:6-methylsalicylate decarboxylase